MSKTHCAKTSGVTKFTVDDDSLLIDCVREFEMLWKMSHPEFKNNLKKDKIWNGIGLKINKTGESCKKRWKSIRDHFMREKKDLSGTGKAAKRKKRATYWENLSFLHYTEDERNGCTNVQEEDLENNSTAEANDLSAEAADLNDDHNPLQDDDVTQLDDDVTQLDDDVTQLDDDVTQLDDDVTQMGLTKSPASTPSSTKNALGNTSSNKKAKKIDPIINFLQQRQFDKNKLVNCFEKVFVEEQKPTKNENDLFFKSMAAIVNKLPPQTQALARNKVFAVISELELAQYSAPSSSATTGPTNFLSPLQVETSSSSYEPSDVSCEVSCEVSNSPNHYQWMDKFVILN